MKRSRLPTTVLVSTLLLAWLSSSKATGEGDVITKLWRKHLSLHSPVNVVVGRIEGQAQLCVQGTFHEGVRTAAAIEMLDAQGSLLWRNQRGSADLDFTVGAYVQWVSGPDLKDAGVLYSFVPQNDQQRGGARLVDAATGRMMVEIENTTRFGNNNAIVADLDLDGQTDLLYPDLATLTRYELPSLSELWRWDRGVRFCWSLPGLFPLDESESQAIVFGSEYNNDDGSSSLLALSPAGEQLWRSDGHVEDLGSTPVFQADVDGDGKPELLKVGLDLEHRLGQPWNHLYVFDCQGALLSEIELGFTGIAIGDMDNDGQLEGVGLSNTRDGGNNGRHEIRCLDLSTGKLQWATPIERAYLDTNSPVMADLNGDGRLEAIVGTGNPAGYARLPDSDPWGDLYVVSSTGEILQHQEFRGWPVNLALCDLGNDGIAELAVVVDGKPGCLVVYRTSAVTTRTAWPTPFGDPRRSGTMALVETQNR